MAMFPAAKSALVARSIVPYNVRGHRADEMTQTIRYAASEAPGEPRG